jgi:hypothetical protein
MDYNYYYSQLRSLVDRIVADPVSRDALIFVGGVLVGYALRSLSSARRRARARKSRRDFVS